MCVTSHTNALHVVAIMGNVQNIQIVYKNVPKTQNAKAAAVEESIAHSTSSVMQTNLIVIIVNLIPSASATYVQTINVHQNQSLMMPAYSTMNV